MKIKEYIKNISDERWNIGFIQNRLENILHGESLEVGWMKHSYKDRWFADPFILDVTDDIIHVLAEEFYKPIKRGRIAHLIIDRNTLEDIDSYDLMDQAYYNAPLIRSFGKFIDVVPFHDKVLYHFSDTYIFPTSDIMMKEKTWLWRNERDWKKWMLHMKEQEKIKKTYILKYHD